MDRAGALGILCRSSSYKLGFPALGYLGDPAFFFLSVFQRGSYPLDAAGLVFCITVTEKQVPNKTQHKLFFYLAVACIDLFAGKK